MQKGDPNKHTQVTFGESVVIPKFASALRFLCALFHNNARWRFANVRRQAASCVYVLIESN